MSGGIGDRPFEPLARAPRARLTTDALLPPAETQAVACPGLLELRVQRRQRFFWACVVGILLVFAGRFLYLSVQHLYVLNRYVAWSSNGPLPAVLSDAEGRLRLPAQMQDRLTKLMHELSLARAQTEPLTQQSTRIVPEVEGSTSPDVCRIDYGGSARDLCRSLAHLPDSKTWSDLEPSVQSLLATFASAMPTKREIGCNGSSCYPRHLAEWLGLKSMHAAGYPLVTPLIYLADDHGDVDGAESVISYPKRAVSSGYKIGDRPWYRAPVEGNPETWLSLVNTGPSARCALTDPYQDVGSVFGIVRTLVCWPVGEAADARDRDHQRPPFLLAIDLWWADALPAWPATTIDAALHLEQTLPVSIAIVALLICVLALVSLRHHRHDLVYLVRCANLEGSQRDKSIVREVGTKTEKQAGVKLAGSIAAWFSAEATHRQHNAQTESLVLRIDYEQEPDVRGIELWEIYCVREHSLELLGLCLRVRWGVHAPRWTSIVTHTAESLPRIEYLGGQPAHATHNAGLAERIEAQVRSGIQGELTHEPMHTRASLLSASKLPRCFPELARYQKQSERLSAGRFRFGREVEVITSLYPQADIEAVQRLPDMLRTLTDERRLLLQLGNHLGRVALCESEQEWEEVRTQQREQLYALSQVTSASRLRVGFIDRLATRLQRQNIRDFGLLDRRTIIVFDRETTESSGYVSTKRADVAFYRYVFEALWSTGKRFEV